MQFFQRNLFWILGLAALFAAGYYFSDIVAYILVAWVLSMWGKPLMAFFLKRVRWRQWRLGMGGAAALTILTFYLFLAGLVLLIVPTLVAQGAHLAGVDYAALGERLREPFAYLDGQLHQLGLLKPAESLGTKTQEVLAAWFKPALVGDYLGAFLSTAGNVVVAFVSITFILFFFLQDNRLFLDILHALTPDEQETKVHHAVEESSDVLNRYFRGLALQTGAFIGVVTVLLWLFGVPNALLIGVMGGIFNIVPYIGPIIGIVLGCFVTLSSHLDADFALTGILLLKVIGAFSITQFIDNNFVGPMITSSSVKAHPLEIFIVTLVAAKVGGVGGMIVGVPVYTVVRVIARVFFSEWKLVRRWTGHLKSWIPLLFLIAGVAPVFSQNDSTVLLAPERLLQRDVLPRKREQPRLLTLTATRNEETVDDLPFRVQVITSEEILRNGYVTLADVLRAMPGLRVSQPGNALEGELFQVRGLLGNQYIKILINDVPVKPSAAPGMPIGAQLPVRQAERIELYLGAASALYGNEACAGVVNIIIKESERPVFTQADLSFGNLGYNSLDLMFGGRLGTDKNSFRFSVYGSSTVRDQTDLYWNNNLFDLKNYLPFGLDSTAFLVSNYQPVPGPGLMTTPKLINIAHESRMFGLNLKWRGLQFTYHRMTRIDHAALGLNPLAVSWSNGSSRVNERLETYTLGFHHTRRSWASQNVLSVTRYEIDNNSTNNPIFDRLSSVLYYTQQDLYPTEAEKQALRQRIYDAYASDDRYIVGGGVDVWLESRWRAKIGKILALDVGGQLNIGAGVPVTTNLANPVDVSLLSTASFTAKPFDPVFLVHSDLNLFGQFDWQFKRLRLIAGTGVNLALGYQYEVAPRVGLLYRIDSFRTIFANFGDGFRRPSLYSQANSATINRYTNAVKLNTLNLGRTESVRTFEGGFRSETFTLTYYYQEGRHLLRPGLPEPILTAPPSDSFYRYGWENSEGRSLSVWGITCLLTSPDVPFSLGEKNNSLWSPEFFIQYARGREWFDHQAPAIKEVRNMPRWTTQFRSTWRTPRFALMIASNRQTSVLSKSVVYRDFFGRKTDGRAPTFRTWDAMVRIYLSDHFLVYFHALNIFNKRYAGLDATGTPDDLLFNPQQGRLFRFGVNYTMN